MTGRGPNSRVWSRRAQPPLRGKKHRHLWNSESSGLIFQDQVEMGSQRSSADDRQRAGPVAQLSEPAAHYGLVPGLSPSAHASDLLDCLKSGTGQRDLLQRPLASTEETGVLTGAAASGAGSLRDDAGRSRSDKLAWDCDGLAAIYCVAILRAHPKRARPPIRPAHSIERANGRPNGSGAWASAYMLGRCFMTFTDGSHTNSVERYSQKPNGTGESH